MVRSEPRHSGRNGETFTPCALRDQAPMVVGQPAGCCAPYIAESFPAPVDFPHDNGVNLPAKEIFPRYFRTTGASDDQGPFLWPTCGLAAPCRLRSRGATDVNVYPCASPGVPPGPPAVHSLHYK